MGIRYNMTKLAQDNLVDCIMFSTCKPLERHNSQCRILKKYMMVSCCCSWFPTLVFPCSFLLTLYLLQSGSFMGWSPFSSVTAPVSVPHKHSISKLPLSTACLPLRAVHSPFHSNISFHMHPSVSASLPPPLSPCVCSHTFSLDSSCFSCHTSLYVPSGTLCPSGATLLYPCWGNRT